MEKPTEILIVLSWFLANQNDKMYKVVTVIINYLF